MAQKFRTTGHTDKPRGVMSVLWFNWRRCHCDSLYNVDGGMISALYCGKDSEGRDCGYLEIIP